MGKTMTTEEFINKAKEKYGDSYDYSRTDYSGMFNKVTVICPIHGEFQTIPHNHLRGAGCKRCGIEKSARSRSDTKEEFIEKARKVHGDRYSYDLVEYKNSDTKVKIICSVHGIFEQHPTTHLGGHGCPKCGYNNKYKESRVWEVWAEGYNCGLDKGDATFIGKVEASSFREACIKLLKGQSTFDEVSLTDWGCQLFDNETDARKRFG